MVLQVVAIDFSADMLQYAKRRPLDWAVTCQPQARIHWVQGDALALPCQDCHFDAATIGYGLRNVDSIAVALKELHRVLKAGATAAILDFNNSDNQVVRWLQSSALQEVVVPMAQTYGLGQEYEYLQPSIQQFPRGKKLCQVVISRQCMQLCSGCRCMLLQSPQ